MHPAARTFRLFVSSTFADLTAEREALQAKVFPQLRDLCQRHGARFQAIDLRWGIPEEAAQDQQTMRICLEEIKRCQETSTRPNFLILLGDRYGWRPLPSEIPAEQFHNICSVSENPELLRYLYPSVDENSEPPVFCLRQRTPDIVVVWPSLEYDAIGVLRAAAQKLGLPEMEIGRYGGSATEQEILKGLLDEKVLPAAKEHVHAFYRNIIGLPAEAGARAFLDWRHNHIDHESQAQLKQLKQRIRDCLGRNVHEFEVAWTGAGIDAGYLGEVFEVPADRALRAAAGGSTVMSQKPTHDRNKFCQMVYDSVGQIMLDEMQQMEEIDPLSREIRAHEIFAELRGDLRFFTGRIEALREIAEYLTLGKKHALVIFGASGSGKSALLARAFGNAEKQHPEAVIVARFIGVTPQSSNGKALIGGLSREIARRYGASEPAPEVDLLKLGLVFRQQLNLARPEKPLILFLDALDQLSSLDEARSLSWLEAAELPENVHIVVSTTEDSPSLEALKAKKLLESDLKRLDPMPVEEGLQLLDLWLRDRRRDVQMRQKHLLRQRFETCGLPLFLRLAFEEARLWRSYDADPQLASDIPGTLRLLFERLSHPEAHGETLVRHSLGYLVAAKNGLSEDEIMDILWNDGSVRQDFQHRFPKSPRVDHLPAAIWSRLYYDLNPYLTERSADGTLLLAFFHRQLREVINTIYLDPKTELERHQSLAEYFEQRATGTNAGGAIGLRTLSELPYQQQRAEMWNKLESTLCDLSFIEAKCAAGLIFDLLADYDAALLAPGLEKQERIRQRLGDMARFVRAQSHLLAEHPKLTLQQALNEPDFTVPAQIARRIRSKEERPRFRWINKPQHISPCLLTLYGHGDYVTTCDVSGDGKKLVSSSCDKTLKIWDVESAKELATLHGHGDSVESCAFSPDGKWIVSGARNGEVKLWDVASAQEIPLSGGHQQAVPACRFSPDGRCFATASWDGELRIWDTATQKVLHTLRGHGQVYCFAFSKDGRRIVSGGADALLRIWDVETGIEEQPPFKGHKNNVMNCTFSEDDMRVFSSSEDETVREWDVATRKEVNTYEGHQAKVWSLALSSDGARLASGAQDGTIKIWDVKTAEAVATMKEHTGEVWTICFLPDGGRMVSGSWDQTIKLWDLALAEEAGRGWQTAQVGDPDASGYPIAGACSPDGSFYAAGESSGHLKVWNRSTARLGKFQLHKDYVMCCAFSPDSRWVVSGDWQGSLKLFDALGCKEGPSLDSHPTKVVSCGFSRDGRRMMSCCSEELRIWECEGDTWKQRRVWLKGAEPFAGSAFSPSGTFVVSGFKKSGTLKLWDVDSERTAMFDGTHPEFFCCALSPSGRLLATVSSNTTVRVWDVAARTLKTEFRGHTADVISCNFSPDEKQVVSGSWDHQGRVWNLENPDQTLVLVGHTNQLQDACFSSDGTRIISAAVDGAVRLWDAKTGAPLGYIQSPANVASLCAFSPDGKHLMTASHRHAIKIWNAQGELEGVLEGHQNAIHDCRFIDDSTVLSASADGALKVWDLGGKEALRTLRGHTGPVESIAISPDGKLIASGARDSTVRLWDLHNGEELFTLRSDSTWVTWVGFGLSGTRVLTCTQDGLVNIWDASNGQRLHILKMHESFLNAASVSPDGSQVVTGGADGTVCVADLRTGALIRKMAGHSAGITRCCYGTRVLSCARNGTLNVWEIEQEAPVFVAQAHAGPVHTCCFAPGGQLVVSGGEDQFARLWNINTGMLMGEYWAGASVEAITWQLGTNRVAVGDGAGRLHLLELEGLTQASSVSHPQLRAAE